jgi:hypothetical protein
MLYWFHTSTVVVSCCYLRILLRLWEEDVTYLYPILQAQLILTVVHNIHIVNLLGNIFTLYAKSSQIALDTRKMVRHFW